MSPKQNHQPPRAEPPRLVVVGGHTRNIGKTSVVAGLIQALPQFDWTAMKITQFGHGICSASGTICGCCLAPDHPFAVDQERQPTESDSGRFLGAGARRSYWVRTAMGQLGSAIEAVREVQAGSTNLIVESNSLVEFLRPDLFLMVLDPAQSDFKASSRRVLAQADACVVIDRGGAQPSWKMWPASHGKLNRAFRPVRLNTSPRRWPRL